MRLVSVGVENLGRFADRTELRCDGKLVAIVGPNEAGKSSLLRALTHLSSGAGFTESERTRGPLRTHPARVVWARYLIEESDRAHLTGIGASDVRWYVSWQAHDNGRFHQLEGGSIGRDKAPRERASRALERAAKHRLLGPSGEEENPWAARASALAGELRSSGEDLDAETIERIRALGTDWPGPSLKGAPNYVATLGDELVALGDHEEQENPRTAALTYLRNQRPDFLLFGADERNLRSEYDLADTADDPPSALGNLASLAALDLPSLRDAIASERGLAAKMLERANARLREVFAEAWHQDDVYLRLETDEQVLRVFVSAPERYTSVAERSDGLRAFLALLTFTQLHSTRSVPPVLLVDEAETHLHYDAQADLIRVFTKQEAASKIIYTTHSAGCLPEDLGVGVRIVVPDPATGTSRIENSFWSGGPGFTPLLLGMGASAFSFAATRRAVLVEGGSDVVLLPTMLREATGRESLDFQVAPGLAEVHPLDVWTLGSEAAHVGYLVDNDSDGTKITTKLRHGGVPNDAVVRLGVGADIRTPEDLLAVDVYVEAVNAELTRSHGDAFRVTPSDVGTNDRAARVAAWCKKRGIDAPAKVNVAYRLLESAAEGRQIVATDQLLCVRKTYIALTKALNLLPA